MKVYVIKGSEGQDGYLKQSMKLPKSWGAKPLQEVLVLFVDTYNKKHADAPLAVTEWHLEKPLGSTLFPDDLVSTSLTEYCDVHCVEGTVKYIGPPPGTAALLEIKEAEEQRIREIEAARKSAEEDAAAAAAGIMKKQWSVKIRCVALDRGGMDVKSQYKVGDTCRVVIEPHATIGMLANRIGLQVGSHPKHQFMYHPREGGALGGGPVLDPLQKLKDVMNEQTALELIIKMPAKVIKVIEELSDDEGCTGAELAAPPNAPTDKAECEDCEQQSTLKASAAQKKSSGDLAGALLDLDAAVALGGHSAQLLCARAEVLLKAKRPSAAKADANAALAANPDSAKAYKLRAKARRALGEYEESTTDFGQAQRIDFDDSIVDEQAYVTKRSKKIRAIEFATQESAERDAERDAKPDAKP